MKLVFFSFAFLFGVLLIHAQEGPAPVAAAPASQPSADKTQTEATVKTLKSEDGSKPGSHDNNTASEHSENKPPKPDSQTPAVKSTASPPHSTITPKPTPRPAGPGSWNVTDPITHVACIMISGNISLDGTLKNYKGYNETRVDTLEPNATVSGNCTEKYIRWDWGNNNSLQFQFEENTATQQVYLGRVDGQMSFPHIIVGFNKTNLHDLEAPKNKSFYCAKSIELPLVRENEREFTLKMEDVRVQAFKTSKSKDFDESIDGCPTPSGGGPDVIPIVVGCALAILVVVVLVAYLINRRRSQAHGYLSM